MFGFLNIYKPKGITSHDVVSVLRKTFKIKQIGHTGTLDPFAQGVLPVCVGKATRLIEYLDEDKEYLATVQFGASSDTYDVEGKITQKVCIDKLGLDSEIISNALSMFCGEIEQTPPIYSAIKMNGKKLYEYARQGISVEIKPRKIYIERIDLQSYNEILGQAKILIKCSKGTYIRSIANDLGNNLGTGGYLTELVRTQSGKFRVEYSVNLYDVNAQRDIINPLNILDLPVVKVENEELEKIKNGIPIKNIQKLSGNVILVYNDNVICAIACADDSYLKLKKVFL